MDYFVPRTIRALARNVQSGIDDDTLEVFGLEAQTLVDSRLAAKFTDWPQISTGTDASLIPPAIIRIVNWTAAATIERTKFAQNEAGINQRNPWAEYLEQTAMRELEGICNGDSVVPGLTRFDAVQQLQPDQADGFVPVTGLTHSIGTTWDGRGDPNVRY